MLCRNCGNRLNESDLFCSSCGAKVENQTNTISNNINTTQTIPNINNSINQSQQVQQNLNQEIFNNQTQVNNVNSFVAPTPEFNTTNNQLQINTTSQQPIKPKSNKLIKILAIIGGIVVGLIILFVAIFSITSASSEKLVCKSSEGNITIMYKDSGITGYTANGMSYDLDAQQEVAKEIGMDAYITEFNDWFTSNTSGYCTIDGKKVSDENNNQQENTNQEENIEDGKRVGSDEFGYITIPENWANFVDVDGNSTLQYSYANLYIATLYAVPTTQIDAYNYASNIMNQLQSEGVQNIQGATVNVGKYTAYQVYGYYSNENIWLVCWFFEAEDGKTHYISIEGPDPNSEYFNIPNTFSITK